MNIHPKTSGAALFGALGVLIAAILHSISGVHLTPETYGSIPAFLAAFGAWLMPSPPAQPLVPIVVQMQPVNEAKTPDPTVDPSHSGVIAATGSGA